MLFGCVCECGCECECVRACVLAGFGGSSGSVGSVGVRQRVMAHVLDVLAGRRQRGVLGGARILPRTGVMTQRRTYV